MTTRRMKADANEVGHVVCYTVIGFVELFFHGQVGDFLGAYNFQPPVMAFLLDGQWDLCQLGLDK